MPARAHSIEAAVSSPPDATPQAGARHRAHAVAGVSALAVLTLVASALNYLSSAIFSRVLNPVGFSELTALLALAAIVAVPTSAAQTVVAERVSFYSSAGRNDIVRYLVRHGIAHILVIAAVGTAVYVACIPLVVELLDLQISSPAIALAPVVFFGFVTPFALGVLQGLNRLVLFGLLLVAVSLARIVFGAGWASVGGGAGGAIGGQAIGMLGVVLLSAWFLRGSVRGRGSGAATSGLRRKPDVRTVSASAAFVAFAVISNLDLILAKALLDREAAGDYAAIATVGKVVTFLPAAIAVAMVPNAAKAQAAGDGTAKVLRNAAALVLATAALAAVPVLAAPSLVISIMFGDAYVGARDGLLPIVLAGAALAMLYLLVVYSVAIRDQRWSLLLVLGVAVQVGGALLFHESAFQIACVQAVAAIAVLAINEVFSHSLLPRRA